MEEIAQVYSRSLFEVAKEHGVLDEVRDQLGEFADALEDDRELQVFFFSPYFSSQEKKEGIAKVLSGADEHFQRFLELLAERHRMPAIFRIRRAYDSLWAKENRLLEVSVTSAVPLDEKTVASIGKAVEKQTDRKVELQANVDDDVLGGIVLQVGNTVLDASVRNRLERLRKQVTRAA
ncbi:MAG: ATP synthase F1 subunit delta [Thermoleophilaceae bacterium]